MDNDRKFGIEIECIATVDRHTMAGLIAQALRDAGINQTCTTGFYTHDQGNDRTWKIKPDGSVHGSSSFPNGMEIVSPILKGEMGLKAVKAVCEVLEGDRASANVSTGLHVHHDVKSDEDVRHLINAWIDHEQHFLKVLPRSRQDNTYCKRWQSRASKIRIGHGTSRTVILNNVQNWWRRNFAGRYFTLNMEGWMFRGAAEYRLHSGTVEYEKISNWIVATQIFHSKALAGQMNGGPCTFEELMERLVDNDEMPAPRPEQNLEPEDNNYFIDPDAKRQRLPKQGTKMGVIAKMILDGCFTKETIIAELDEQFGPASGKGHRFQVGCKLSDFASRKYGFGWNIKTRENGTIFIEVPNSTGGRDTITFTASQLDRDAVAWMKARREHFGN